MYIHRHFPACARRVWYSIDSSSLNGGSECFKAKARHVKEINVLLLSPALIRALLSAENDRACTFHYVLLLASGALCPSLLLALSFFFSGKKCFQGQMRICPQNIYFLDANGGMWVLLCVQMCVCPASISFFVNNSGLLSKIWQSNWHFVSQTWRILLPLYCIKLFKLSNAEARVWVCAFFGFCFRRPSSWRAMSVWNYWNRRFKAWWTHSQDERAVLTCSQLTCTFKYE